MHTSRRCCFVLFAVGALALGSGLQAQYSGTYTINAKGSGSRNFKSFNEATAALAKHGVTGPVEMVVVGMHGGAKDSTNQILPIPGTSRRNRVLFRATDGSSGGLVGYVKGDIIGASLVFVSSKTSVVKWVKFHKVEFYTNVVGRADHLEIGYGSPSIWWRGGHIPGINLVGSDVHVHHCRIAPNWPFNYYVLSISGDGARVHHNEVGGYAYRVGAIGVQGNGARIFNNLVYGYAGIGCGKNSLVAHNTVATDVDGSNGIVVGDASDVVANICVGTGTFVYYGSQVRSRDNLFAYRSTTHNKVFAQAGSQGYASLAALQKAGYDAGSMVVAPKFVKWDKKYGWVEDAHLEFDSPAINALRKRIKGVRVDLDGLSRDGKPDIGCYEFRVTSNFGTGCPGTRGRVPKLGFHGRAVVGSKNFAITLSNALGRARALLVFGASKEKWGSVELPYNLGGTCKMLVAPDAMHMVTVSGRGGGKGRAVVKVVLPTDPKLKGRRVYGQWAVEDAKSAAGLALSGGGALVVR